MGLRGAGAAPLRLVEQPSWLINQLAIPANRLVIEGLAGVGARRYHYSLLVALDELERASQAELSRLTTIDRSDMVAIVRELTEQGYIERTSDPADRRRNVISITPAGRRHLRRLERLLTRVQDELLAPLSPKDRKSLITLLTRLVDYHANLWAR